MKDLVIIGAGGFGRETLALVDEINAACPTWNFLGFIDDNPDANTAEGSTILGGMDVLEAMNPKPYAVISIANTQIRKNIVDKCEILGIPFATLVHPEVKIKGKLCTIGEGSIICDDVILPINSHVGKHCIMNFGCCLGHDTVIDDFVSLMPFTAIAGETHIGKGCYFGVHCTVINQINITDDCTFGAGAVIVKDVTEAGTYVGMPAKLIKPLQK